MIVFVIGTELSINKKLHNNCCTIDQWQSLLFSVVEWGQFQWPMITIRHWILVLTYVCDNYVHISHFMSQKIRFSSLLYQDECIYFNPVLFICYWYAPCNHSDNQKQSEWVVTVVSDCKYLITRKYHFCFNMVTQTNSYSIY